jgi:hypothetical protein
VPPVAGRQAQTRALIARIELTLSFGARLGQLFFGAGLARARQGQLLDAAIDLLGPQIDDTLEALLFLMTHR